MMFPEYSACTLCPRKCGADRYNCTGFCGMGAVTAAAKASLHKWEEPCISYKNGAGTVFFSGCSLRCVYCQNHEISSERFGKELPESSLADVFLRLQDIGADNIELVTPTHFVPHIVYTLEKIRHKLTIPVVYNTGGYELVSTLKMLDGLVDIYLPDMKYYSSDMSARYSGARNYSEYALPALKEMLRQQPEPVFDSEGMMLHGVIVRHLVLPKGYHDSMKLLDIISGMPVRPLVSIMRQYTPCYGAEDFPEINRKLTSFEYNKVTEHCADLGLDGFMQEKGCDTLDMTPDF